MGVATRGVKFKFTSGEKVLCYEPDPTKAKVLYESKVLELVVKRDERGRKVPEYLIHFFGWNSSWDRFVREELILPFTEENRELQTKLAEDAALTIKGKRKSKLPPLIKETLNKKHCIESGKEKPVQPEKLDSSSEAHSSEDESDREVQINLPEPLKRQLEKDQCLVVKSNKLVKLPCEPNVVSILESFVKYLAAKLLCASPPRNSKNGKQLMPDDVKNKLNLCKEAADGIRIYFDFSLPFLLLYRQEQKQLQQQPFFSEIAVSSPFCNAIRDFGKKDASLVKMEHGSLNVTSDPTSSKKELLGNKEEASVPTVERRRRGRPCGRSKAGRRMSKVDSQAKNGSSKKSKILLKPGRPSKHLLKSTRILRSSSDKQQPKKEPSDTKPSTSSNSEPAVAMETRGNRKPLPEEKVPDLQAPSSNSSGHSTLSDSKVDQQYHLISNANLLQDVLNWHLLPPHLCRQVPAPPSLVYGAQHLLRLFVILPDMISKMNISSHKLQPLISILEQLLFYLTEKKEELFLPSAYVDYSDALSVGTSTTV